MRHYLLATALTIAVSPCWANPIMKNSPNASQVYGDGSAAQSQQQKVVFKPQINVAPSANAAGGTGGGASMSGGSRGSSGGGAAHIDARQAPDIVVPSVGGGGSDCPTVGFGASGAGLSGGGGIGPSWISTRCDHRKYAELIYLLTGDREKALHYLASVEPDVRDALADSAAVQPASAAGTAPPPTAAVPAWCRRARPTTEASKAYVAEVCGAH